MLSRLQYFPFHNIVIKKNNFPEFLKFESKRRDNPSVIMLTAASNPYRRVTRIVNTVRAL